ncbi:uncharacterized protein B0T15DRAFT_244436 [Chaetomium strumarium]|uniref:Uncharacterized protein n=1 Tax=Chaetomium strumarium TaxID=1170767 RepID=A0AAJ0GQX9_9PEZI|nr:hypothetical protein B0T15DRAFT_244436 [Chaetomium strumarium]
MGTARALVVGSGSCLFQCHSLRCSSGVVRRAEKKEDHHIPCMELERLKPAREIRHGERLCRWGRDGYQMGYHKERKAATSLPGRYVQWLGTWQQRVGGKLDEDGRGASPFLPFPAHHFPLPPTPPLACRYFITVASWSQCLSQAAIRNDLLLPNYPARPG